MLNFKCSPTPIKVGNGGNKKLYLKNKSMTPMYVKIKVFI